MSETIGAVIIAKDEEEVIERCIRSVLDLDEVVVYDTGSKDRTLELARAFGGNVKVIQGEPIVPFHFAKARNAALEHCTTKWALTIDCDEILKGGSVKAIRKFLAAKHAVHGFQLAYRMRIAEDGRSVQYDAFRIHLVEAWKWRWRVHNELVALGDDQVIAKIDHAMMEHQPPADKRPQRSEQTLELLEVAAKEEPEHTRLFRHLGLEYMNRQKYVEAIPPYERYVRETKDNEMEKSQAMMNLASCRFRSNDIDGAMREYENAHKLVPKRREPLYMAARDLMVIGRYEEAKALLNRVLSIPLSAKPVYHLNWDSVWSSMPEEALAWCEEQLRTAKEGIGEKR